MTASGEPAPIVPAKRRSRFRTAMAVTALVLLVGVPALARLLFVEAFSISAPTMAPNLLVGDHVFVRKDAYGMREHRVPARGDVVVFRHPEHPERTFVQRVIGLPGDTITLQQAAVFINGWRVPTCVVGRDEIEVGGEKRAGIAVVELLGDTAYVVFHDEAMLHARSEHHAHAEQHEEGGESDGHHHAGDSEGPYTVNNNEVFVLGDNRENGDDSRGWFEGRGGGVRADQIKGRATTIWWAVDGAGVNRARLGWSLAASPKCPPGLLPATCAGLERCLAGRPPRDATTPPEDRSTGTASPLAPSPRGE